MTDPHLLDPLLLCQIDYRPIPGHPDFDSIGSGVKFAYFCDAFGDNPSLSPNASSWSGFDGNFLDLPGYRVSLLLDFLTAIGYVSGRTLFGFPYDWRQSHLYAARRLVDFVERRNLTEFDVITHSMGYFVLQNALTYFPSFARRVFGQTIIGAPCEGMGAVWPLLYLRPRPRISRNLELGCISFYEMLGRTKKRMMMTEQPPHDPSLISYSQDAVLTNVSEFNALLDLTAAALATNTISYANDLTVNLSFPFNRSVFHWGFAKEPQLVALEPAASRPVHVIYGALVDVVAAAHFIRDISNPPDFTRLVDSPFEVLAFESGDGVVASDSAACRVAIPHPTTSAGFPKLLHNQLLSDPKPLHLLEKYLGTHCIWDGRWLVKIEGAIEEEMVLHFHPEDLTVTSDAYALQGHLTTGNMLNGTLVGSFGNATFGWEMAPNCSYWSGYWQYDWSDHYHWEAVLISWNYSHTQPHPTGQLSGAFVGAPITAWVVTFSISVGVILTLVIASVFVIRKRGYLFPPKNMNDHYLLAEDDEPDLDDARFVMEDRETVDH